MQLSITIKEKKKCVYSVFLKGSIDTDTHEELENALKKIINENTKAVFLEMAEVDYVSSIGIRVILWAKKALEAESAIFGMVGLQPKIKQIFEVVKLLPIFEIFDNMPDADKYIDQIIEEEAGR